MSKGFNNIVAALSSLFMPHEIAGFFIFLDDGSEEDLSQASFQLPSKGDLESESIVLETIVKAFAIDDAGDVNLVDIPTTTLHGVYEEMVMKPKRTFKLQPFLRMKLKPSYMLLFDLFHKLFLSQSRTSEPVTTFKFDIMATFDLSLQLNWAHLLLAQIKEETMMVVREINSLG